MQIIAGLGNPGSQHAGQRHNIGFMAVDEIVRRHSSFSPWQKKFSAEISEGRIGSEKVLLIKPQTFMNRSGQSVGEAMRFYKLTEQDLTVLYDELDLAPAKVRIKRGGGAGGHNGIRSLDAHCGRDFQRVRLGIGHPGHKDRVTSHVLGNFAKADQDWLEPMLQAISDNIELLVAGDNSGFMNKIALATSQVAPDQSKKKPVKQAAKSQSHIHQARAAAKKPETPKSGPMAEMLKKLLGK